MSDDTAIGPPSVAAPTASIDPRSGSAAARFARGFGYLFRGWSFVLGNHPRLILLCLLPLLINILVFCGMLVALYYFYGDLVNLIWAKPASWFVRIFWYLFYVFIFLLVMLMAYGAFFVVQALLSAPFNDLLSEHTERLAYAHDPPPFSMARLTRNLGRTLLGELTKLTVYLLIIGPLFLMNLILPLVGPALFLSVGFYLTATFFGYDYLDFCMARREWPLGRKWRVLRANQGLMLGFGSALALALLMPVFGILCVPMAAVGGTLLFCDLERAGAFEASGPEPPAPRSL
jgi:CysZ protein